MYDLFTNDFQLDNPNNPRSKLLRFEFMYSSTRPNVQYFFYGVDNIILEPMFMLEHGEGEEEQGHAERNLFFCLHRR